MSKIYFLAVNSSKMRENPDNTYLWMRPYDVHSGCDIAGLVQNLRYSEGWSIYVFTRKQDREEMLKANIQKWERLKRA